MADLDDMLREFAHIQAQQLEEQQAQQRAEQRLAQEEEVEEESREDRERRSSGAERSGSPPRTGVIFAVGGKVLHDLLGESVVRKLARTDDPDNKILIEWSRQAKRKKDPPVILNRWVLPSSLTKIRTSPRSHSQGAAGASGDVTGETQQGLFGAMPDLAAHERKRAAKMKLPEGPRGRMKAERITKESKVPVAQRLREFPNQGLIDSAGKLYCAPCKEIIPNLKNSIDDHVHRNKHTTNLSRYVEKGGDDGELKEVLTTHFRSNPDESGTLTSADTHLYRYRTVETFLFSGTPVERADDFRPLLERSGFSLTGSQHLRQTYIPRIAERELECLKRELAQQLIGIHFDGTTRLGEALNMTGRWCTSAFEIKQRLLVFVTAAKHVSAPQPA